MRFNTKVAFYTDPTNKYNPDTGKHDSNPVLVRTVWANVTDNSTQRNAETFGKYDINTKTIRLIDQSKFDWSFLMVGDDPTRYVKKHEYQTSKVRSFLVGQA